jgi:hypothetical protein
LKRQKKSIRTESKEDSSELRGYSIVRNRHLEWKTRDHYLELVEEFLEKKLSISEFCSAFCERGLLNSDVVNILESNFIMKDHFVFPSYWKKYLVSMRH